MISKIRSSIVLRDHEFFSPRCLPLNFDFDLALSIWSHSQLLSPFFKEFSFNFNGRVQSSTCRRFPPLRRPNFSRSWHRFFFIYLCTSRMQWLQYISRSTKACAKVCHFNSNKKRVRGKCSSYFSIHGCTF